MTTLRALTLAILLAGLLPAGALAAMLFKDPLCDCCTAYGELLRAAGFELAVEDTEDLDAVKARFRVPRDMAGCHTTVIDGYAVEGHVPIAVLQRFLAERPDVDGIALPGMPEGSPGMSGTKAAPFEVYTFKDGEAALYAVE